MYKCVYSNNNKDQSGGIYNSSSTGRQGFMAVVNKPCPQAIHPWTPRMFAATNPGTVL